MYEGKLPAEEVSRRAHELYDREIRPNLEAGHAGEYIAVNIETGDYETAVKALDAARALKERKPDATLHLMRVDPEGEAKAAYRLGGSFGAYPKNSMELHEQTHRLSLGETNHQ